MPVNEILLKSKLPPLSLVNQMDNGEICYGKKVKNNSFNVQDFLHFSDFDRCYIGAVVNHRPLSQVPKRSIH